jgi:hypothetical protein
VSLQAEETDSVGFIQSLILRRKIQEAVEEENTKQDEALRVARREMIELGMKQRIWMCSQPAQVRPIYVDDSE